MYTIDSGTEIRMVNESDERNLKRLPDPFASSDVSCEGIKTDVVFNDVLLREKVLVVGDSGVGKTKLIESYLMNASKRYAMSNGMEFNVVEVKAPESNIALDLFLFELSGQSILRQIQQRCVQEHCSYIIFVFDISSRKTLESAKNWVASVRSTNLKDIPVLLVGNKIDLRQVC